jgi:hypothetical protein
MIVVRGEEARRILNDLELPMAEPVEASEGEVQRLTPTIDALYVPDADDSLDTDGGAEIYAAALDVEPGTGALWNSLAGRWLWGGLAVAVLVSVLVIAGLRSSGTDSGASAEQLPQAVSAAPAARVAAGGAQGKSRKTMRPEKKSATPAAAVSEPSFARAPTTKKRSAATNQPASEPVASSPAPSSSGGGSNDSPPQVQNDPPPQVQHGIGGGEAWHGIVPGGG